ncbi:hypothetical protein FA09DRAFT_219832 [Tilletiopsis washingtonensis]|uniref:Uncharacterized protein n=1 Tax=Tilletiopsis washingtonensis TaxID=58919 RepID=A0A316ZE42_9BASI|nr:hypothetical protein FA09DRAFT_219832 [Tilletiopsis washingtonensis]PWN99799.1 hypothetical protein FA09DRAFT_219832 [Tilletiopsis washingtonensis]
MLRLWSSSSLNAAAEGSGSDPLVAPESASAAPQTPSTSTPPLGRASDSASPWQRTPSMSRSSSPASASRSHSSNKSSPLRASPSTPRAAPASDGDGEDSFLGRWEGDDSAELDADADRSAQSTSRDVTSDSLSRQQFVFKPRPSSSTERMVAGNTSANGSSRDQENVPVRPSPVRQAAAGSGPRTPLSARPAHSMQHSSPQVPQTPRSDALRRGLLRRPATPGTGSSVRFGSRLYDDGDESRISNSTTLSDSTGNSPARTVRPESQSADMSDSLLERMAFVAREEESNESIQAVELSLGASLSSADGPPDELTQGEETQGADTFDVKEGETETAGQQSLNGDFEAAPVPERAASPPSMRLEAINAQDISLSLSPPSGSVALASFDDMSALIDESINGGPMALANQPSAPQWERMLPFGQQSPSARLDLAQATPRAPKTSTESAVSASGSLDSELSLSESYLAKQGNIAAQSVPAVGHSPSPRSNNSVQHSRFATPSSRAAESPARQASVSPRAYTSSPGRSSPSTAGSTAPTESNTSISSDRGARLVGSPGAQYSSPRQPSSFSASATIRRASASSSPVPATSSPLRSVVTRTPSPRSPARELDESVQSVGAAWATPNMSSATSAPGTGRTYHSVATPETQPRAGPSSASSSSMQDASSPSHASSSEASPSVARAARRPPQPQQASVQAERLAEPAASPAADESNVENSMSQQAAALSAPMSALDELSTASPSLGRRRAGPRASDVALDQLLSAVTELDAVHSSRTKNILQRSYSGEQEASELRAALINSERGLAETLGAARKLQAAQREAQARILQLEQERLQSAKRQAEVEELARRLKDQLYQEEHRLESEDVDKLKEELANERRLRESERRDFEYRIWDAQRQSEPESKPVDVISREAADSAVEAARREVQQACEMDADVRAYGVEVEHARVVEDWSRRVKTSSKSAASRTRR